VGTDEPFAVETLMLCYDSANRSFGCVCSVFDVGVPDVADSVRNRVVSFGVTTGHTPATTLENRSFVVD